MKMLADISHDASRLVWDKKVELYQNNPFRQRGRFFPGNFLASKNEKNRFVNEKRNSWKNRDFLIKLLFISFFRFPPKIFTPRILNPIIFSQTKNFMTHFLLTPI